MNTIKSTASSGRQAQLEALSTGEAPVPATQAPKTSKGYSPSSEHDPKTSPEEYSERFLDFMYKSPTTFHAIANVSKLLEENGFVYLSERELWDDKFAANKGKRFYTTRNGSSLAAFVVGKDWKPGKGIGLIGAHIDALTLKVKPISNKDNKDGYTQIGVAPYAGSLNKTWWDRELGIGGRLIVKDDKAVRSKLVKIPHPIGIIPSLAPHFGLPENGPFNKETQMTPIYGLEQSYEDEPEATEDEKKSPVYGKHSLPLLRELAKRADVELKDVLSVELEMFDVHHGEVGGLRKDLLFCPRIDDKICSYAAINGLIEGVEKLEKAGELSIVALYDNEEIGSLQKQGAQGNLMEGVVDRVLAQYGSDDEIKRLTYANSFFVSSDVCHAVNPNFSEVYLEHHKPRLNVGPGIYYDPNGHMTTDAVSAAIAEEVGRQAGCELQYFQIRNDSRSGGTIGPYISSKNGIRAIDLGIPQLAMHSIRATTGSKDVWLGVRYFRAVLELWGDIDAQFKLGDL
ncbi:vacuolar aminopeptidase 1 [Trichomonascus vanleenenianus]|uniref:M18 family aminopeptidase n=1 Tax=Trichomonascus vanleenenianus TaxID=2268995 RepID=UPI003ECA90F8